MKEIKAYIRPYSLETAIKALEDAGAPGITVLEVHPVGYGFRPNYFSTSREFIRSAPQIVKLEMICHDEQVENFVALLLEHTSTGSKGDGRIFISPVSEAIRIRDGQRGADVL